MKKIVAFCLAILCISLLALPAAAVSVADSVKTTASVDSDGSCYITMRLQLRLKREENLTLPLPSGAKEVRLNGKFRTPTQQGGQFVLQLPRLDAGVHTLEISFRLKAVISQKSGGLVAEVPLLTVFPYPVESFSCSVTLPAAPSEQPSVISGYYGESTDSFLQVQVRGNVVSCSSTAPLKDRETLTLRFRGDKEMFPDFSSQQSLLKDWETVIVILRAVAFAYWYIWRCC